MNSILLPFFIKTLLTSLIIVGVSELGKRSTLMASILASLPLTSLLALLWLYHDTTDAEATARLSTGIFWMVLPSLFFFLVFPQLVKFGLRFYPSLIISTVLMIGVYGIYAWGLKRFGIAL